MKNASAVAVALLLVGLFFGPASSSTINAHNEMSWLDGFTLVVLDTDDIAGLHAARATIQAHGGRVAIMSPPSLILGWIPYEYRAELIGTSGIREIYETEVPEGEVDAQDFQTRAMVNFFNAVARGDIQREHFEEAARTEGMEKEPIPNDALRQPDYTEKDYAEYLESLRGVGLDIDELRDRGLLVSYAPGATMGNSDAMTGTISVTLFFVESDGSIDPNLYTWTQAHMYEYVNKASTGLAWWTARSYNHFDCWNAFLVHFYPGTDTRCQTGYEPILHNGTGTAPNANTWIKLIMAKFGYSAGESINRVGAFNTWQRATYGTNWAFSGFIPYNPPPAATQFLDGTAAWAYLGGSYNVDLFRAFSWDPSQVFPHETGHIFYACDEYAESGCTCDCVRFIGTVPNNNCENCAPYTGCMMRANSYSLCANTPAQVGWLGFGCAPAPLPAPVATNVSPNHEQQGVTRTITVTGSNFVYGAYVDMGSDVTLNYTNFINSTTFEANVTVSNTAPPGMRNVVVYNRDLQSSTITEGFEIKPSTKHYASPSGGNVFPYITPGNAATSLADAIAAAGAGDSLLVVSTTYSGVNLTINKGVRLYGAWDASFTSRDLATGKTVFQLTGNVKVGPGATGQVRLDGFEIHGGTGSAQVSPIAGFYGGAIWATTSNLAVANCLIRNSQAHDGTYGAGGGIYASGCTIDVLATEIRDCAAAQGGAVFFDDCTGSIASCSIHDNDLLFSSQPAIGGGVHISNSSGIAFSGNTIHANTADPPFAGAMNGGGIYLKNATGVTMDGDVVSNNISGMSGAVGYSGGMHVQNSGVTMTGVTLSGNQAKTMGGAVYGDATSTVVMIGGKILNNSAMIGGGVYVSGPTSQVDHNLWVGNSGTACYFVSAASGSFIGNTMHQNSGMFGGGAYFSSTSVPVVNNIVTNSTGSGIKCSGAPIPTPTYCDSWNNTTNYDGVTPGTGCISLDPLYVNAAGGDFHLGIHSPAIDAGDPNVARNDPDGSRGDMGVYGSHAFDMDQPEYPKGLVATLVSGDAVVRWRRNPEADVASYAVYKNTDPNFVPSLGTFVTLVTAPDTTHNDGAYVDGTYYKVSAIDADGYAGGYAGPVEAEPTGIGDGVASAVFRLHQNSPNPFNPTTRIRYEVATRVHVSLDVFDVRGDRVRRLVDEAKGPGSFVAEWDGKNTAGERASTGVYFYRLTAGSFSETRKMVLLK